MDEAPPMSDRDIITEIERRLTDLDRDIRYLSDPEYQGAFSLDADILDPINAILVFLEETRPPD